MPESPLRQRNRYGRDDNPRFQSFYYTSPFDQTGTIQRHAWAEYLGNFDPLLNQGQRPCWGVIRKVHPGGQESVLHDGVPQQIGFHFPLCTGIFVGGTAVRVMANPAAANSPVKYLAIQDGENTIGINRPAGGPFDTWGALSIPSIAYAVHNSWPARLTIDGNNEPDLVPVPDILVHFFWNDVEAIFDPAIQYCVCTPP